MLLALILEKYQEVEGFHVVLRGLMEWKETVWELIPIISAGRFILRDEEVFIRHPGGELFELHSGIIL